jgi:hypothetical protein
MSRIETIQMDRYDKELEDDVRHIVKKYCRMMGWSIPEVNEAEAERLILESLRRAVEKVANE